MRYKKKIKYKVYVEPKVIEPKVGDFKEDISFAYLPVRISYKERVFWEKYINVYRYQTVEMVSYDPETCSGIKFKKDKEGRLWYNRWCLYKRKYYEMD